MTALLDALLVWFLAPITMLGVSAAYFYASPSSQPLVLRALVASPGVAATSLLAGSWLAAAILSPSPEYRQPFLVLWLVPVLLAVISATRFAGQRRLQVLLVPLVAAMLWALVTGYTVVGGGK